MAMTHEGSAHFSPSENYMNHISHGHIPLGRNQPEIKNKCLKKRKIKMLEDNTTCHLQIPFGFIILHHSYLFMYMLHWANQSAKYL
jgi:hypothetical protein